MKQKKNKKNPEKGGVHFYLVKGHNKYIEEGVLVRDCMKRRYKVEN